MRVSGNNSAQPPPNTAICAVPLTWARLPGFFSSHAVNWATFSSTFRSTSASPQCTYAPRNVCDKRSACSRGRRIKPRGLDSTSNTDPPQGSRTHPRQVEELRVDFVRPDQTQRSVKNDCVKDGPKNLRQLMRAEFQVARWRELDNLAAAHGSDASSASMNMVFMGDGKSKLDCPRAPPEAPSFQARSTGLKAD